jgi:hypothetical protein
MAAQRTTGAGRPASAAASIRGFGVVLERIESQMAAVLEAVTSSSDRLDTRIDTLEARLSRRISALEDVVRQHSERVSALEQVVREHSKRIGGLENEVVSLKNEVARLRHDFDHREERGRMEALEVRVAALEARLGLP